MNNSKINIALAGEPERDFSPLLRSREKELLEILEAIQSIQGSSYWKTLEEKVFKGLTEGLDRKLRTESNPQKSAWLQGAISISEKYEDFSKFGESYRLELSRIRNNLHGQTKNPGDGSTTSS